MGSIVLRKIFSLGVLYIYSVLNRCFISGYRLLTQDMPPSPENNV